MLVMEANDLLTPFLRHKGFKEFEAKTPRLSELTKQIRGDLDILATKHILVDCLFGIGLESLDVKTAAAFREFAAICKEGLK